MCLQEEGGGIVWQASRVGLKDPVGHGCDVCDGAAVQGAHQARRRGGARRTKCCQQRPRAVNTPARGSRNRPPLFMLTARCPRRRASLLPPLRRLLHLLSSPLLLLVVAPLLVNSACAGAGRAVTLHCCRAPAGC